MRPKPFERICQVCKTKQNKYDMIKFCKVEGEIIIDKNFSQKGKGAYICNNCIKHLNENKGLNKAFKTNVSNEIYEKINKQLN